MCACGSDFEPELWAMGMSSDTVLPSGPQASTNGQSTVRERSSPHAGAARLRLSSTSKPAASIVHFPGAIAYRGLVRASLSMSRLPSPVRAWTCSGPAPLRAGGRLRILSAGSAPIMVGTSHMSKDPSRAERNAGSGPTPDMSRLEVVHDALWRCAGGVHVRLRRPTSAEYSFTRSTC